LIDRLLKLGFEAVTYADCDATFWYYDAAEDIEIKVSKEEDEDGVRIVECRKKGDEDWDFVSFI